MFTKTFAEIGTSDLQQLISAHAQEHQMLEFKRDVWGNSDEDIREMLRDISSMANAYGGHIVVGMDEDASGVAVSLVPVPDADGQRDRIFASSLANLQPRVRGLEIKTIEFEPGKQVLLIKVPNSIDLHQITFKGLYQFWVRHDRQKTKMSYEEIRDAINRMQVSLTRSQELWQQRKAAFASTGQRLLLLSISPLRLGAELLDITDANLRRVIEMSNKDRTKGWTFTFRYKNARPSLNGLTVGGIASGRGLEVYRSGYIEAYAVLDDESCLQLRKWKKDNQEYEQQILKALPLVEYIHSFARRAQEIYEFIGYDGPAVVTVQLLNISSLALAPAVSERMLSKLEPWQEYSLEIEPQVFDYIHPDLITKRICDRIWQAFGYENEPVSANGVFDFSQFG